MSLHDAYNNGAGMTQICMVYLCGYSFSPCFDKCLCCWRSVASSSSDATQTYCVRHKGTASWLMYSLSSFVKCCFSFIKSFSNSKESVGGTSDMGLSGLGSHQSVGGIVMKWTYTLASIAPAPCSNNLARYLSHLCVFFTATTLAQTMCCNHSGLPYNSNCYNALLAMETSLETARKYFGC